MDTVEDFLQAHSSEGQLDSHGVFQIDLRQAVQKLGQSLLPSPEYALLKLVQFAYAQQTPSLRIETTTAGLLVCLQGHYEAKPASELLASFVEVVTGQKVDRHLDLFLSFNYFLARGSDLVLTRWNQNRIADQASSGPPYELLPHETPDARFPHSLTVHLTGSVHFKMNLLKKHLAFCEMPITLNGSLINATEEFAQGGALLKQKCQLRYGADSQCEVVTLVSQMNLRDRGSYEAEIIPVKNGVALESVTMKAHAPGIRVAVEANDVESHLETLQLKNCSNWVARQVPMARMLSEVAKDVHLKAQGEPPKHYPTSLGLLIVWGLVLCGMLYLEFMYHVFGWIGPRAWIFLEVAIPALPAFIYYARGPINIKDLVLGLTLLTWIAILGSTPRHH